MRGVEHDVVRLVSCPGASRWFVEVCLCMALSCKAFLLHPKKKYGWRKVLICHSCHRPGLFFRSKSVPFNRRMSVGHRTRGEYHNIRTVYFRVVAMLKAQLSPEDCVLFVHLLQFVAVLNAQLSPDDCVMFVLSTQSCSYAESPTKSCRLL
jgi:hypothetical protein